MSQALIKANNKSVKLYIPVESSSLTPKRLLDLSCGLSVPGQTRKPIRHTIYKLCFTCHSSLCTLTVCLVLVMKAFLFASSIASRLNFFGLASTILASQVKAKRISNTSTKPRFTHLNRKDIDGLIQVLQVPFDGPQAVAQLVGGPVHFLLGGPTRVL